MYQCNRYPVQLLKKLIIITPCIVKTAKQKYIIILSGYLELQAPMEVATAYVMQKINSETDQVNKLSLEKSIFEDNETTRNQVMKKKKSTASQQAGYTTNKFVAKLSSIEKPDYKHNTQVPVILSN